MEQTNIEKRKPGKAANIVFFSITLLIVLFIIEGLLSVYMYQKGGAEKLASIEALKAVKKMATPQMMELNVTNHNLVRPDSTEAVNKKIAEEVIRSNKFVYESWIEYRNVDFDGKYMNMAGAMRKSSPDAYINTKSQDTLDIYFFGGSTMFGFNVLDYETIPSQFVQLYKEKFPEGKSIRVYNYATPTFYSYQELIMLSNLIYNGHRPKYLVFLDGLNDFWFATASYYRQSYFSYIFRQIFNRGLRSKGEFKFVDTAEAMFKNPPYMDQEKYNNGLIENYVKNMDNIRLMAKMINAKAYFFCQPSPFYNYPNQQKDPMCFKDTLTRFNDIYPKIEKRAPALQNFTFMGNMLKDRQGYPFVDGLHYSPGFIKDITASILSTMENDLQLTSVVKQTKEVAAFTRN